MATSAFDQWATATLNQIGAPVNATNMATLQKWATKESGGSPMRWNNPLNTTQPSTGSKSMNSVGVQSYPTVAIGAQATAVTLVNGRYPGILAALRQSVPTASWLSFDSQIGAQLGTWGSGTNWLGGATPPATNFLASSTTSPPAAAAATNPCAGLTGFPALWCLATNPSSAGSTIGGAAGSFGTIISKVMYIGSGILLVSGGLTLLVIIVLKGPAGVVAGVAGAVTPQGRAIKAVGTAASVKSTNAEITANRKSLTVRKRTPVRKGIQGRGAIAADRAHSVGAARYRNQPAPRSAAKPVATSEPPF